MTIFLFQSKSRTFETDTSKLLLTIFTVSPQNLGLFYLTFLSSIEFQDK